MEKEQEPIKASDDTSSPASTPAPVVVAGQKSPRKKLVVFGIIGLIVLVGAIYLGVVLYSQNPQSKVEEKGPTSFASSKDVLAGIKSQLTGTQAEVDVVTSLGGSTNDGYGLYGVAAYTVGNREFQNYPAQSEGFAFKGDSDIATADYKAIVNFFKSHKAKEVASGVDAPGYLSDTPEQVNFVAYASYDTGKQICMAWHVDASQTPLASHIASLGCADKSSYESASKALDVFYTAFKAKENSKYETLALGSPVLGGGLSGYEYAIVHQEFDDTQYEGLYYRATGSKSWTHLLLSQGVADCADFVSDEAKKSFDGFDCLDDSGNESKVKS